MMLMEAAQQGNPEAAQILQQMNPADPRLNEVVEVRNNVQEMDVDIIMTDSPNTESLWQETFESLMELAKAYGPEAVPFSVALELSRLPNLKDVKALLNPPVDPEMQQQQQQMQEMMFQLEVGEKTATIKAKDASANKDMAETQAKILEMQKDIEMWGNTVESASLDNAKKALDNIQKQVETVKLAQEPTDNVSVSV
jgi:hypothetical protein